MSRRTRPNPEPIGTRDLDKTCSFSQNRFAKSGFQPESDRWWGQVLAQTLGRSSKIHVTRYSPFHFFSTGVEIIYIEERMLRESICLNLPGSLLSWVNAINNTHYTANVKHCHNPFGIWGRLKFRPIRFHLHLENVRLQRQMSCGQGDFDSLGVQLGYDPRQSAVSCSMKLVTIAKPKLYRDKPFARSPS